MFWGRIFYFDISSETTEKQPDIKISLACLGMLVLSRQLNFSHHVSSEGNTAGHLYYLQLYSMM